MHCKVSTEHGRPIGTSTGHLRLLTELTLEKVQMCKDIIEHGMFLSFQSLAANNYGNLMTGLALKGKMEDLLARTVNMSQSVG